MSETTTQAGPAITWETKVRGWHGKHRGKAHRGGWQFAAFVQLQSQTASASERWTAQCRLSCGNDITKRATFSAPSWQACRAAMQRQARAWFAEHGKGGAA